ncbi:MAG: PrpR N-terminal domain-containing protein, partial [Rhodocyclaceae bacterium]
MSAQPFRFTLISPYPTLTAIVRTLAPAYRCEVVALQAVLDEAREVTRQALKNSPDLFLSRGGTADYVRAMAGEVPVIALRTSALDLLAALQPFRGHIGHAAFFNYGSHLCGVADIAQALDMRIDEYVFHSQEEMSSQLWVARQHGTELIVGGQLTVRLATRADLACVLLETGEHSVHEMLREAINVAEVRRTLAGRTARLQTVLDNIAEGVIVSDENDRVETINRAAASLLNTPAEAAIGQPIAHIVPGTRAPTIRVKRTPEFGEVLDFGGRQLVANRVPILTGARCLGVVCTFSEA